MRDYWLVQLVLSTVGWLYLAGAVIALIMAWRLPKTKLGKATAFGIVFILVLIIPAQGLAQYIRDRQIAKEQAVRYAEANALFEERCKTAGERIYATAKHVDGVFIARMRKRSNSSDQFDPNDPAGDAAHGEGLIETFLMGRPAPHSPNSAFLLLSINRKGAYQFVEIPGDEPDTFVRYRDARPRGNSTDQLPSFLMTREVGIHRVARYTMDWQDISTPEDRKFWIAGSRIVITDSITGRLMAERVGYIFDAALGSQQGGRQPWQFALRNACPTFPLLHDQYPHRWGLMRNFAEKIIQPADEEKK